MSNADLISMMSTYLTYTSIIIAAITLILAAMTVLITIHFNRDRKKLIQESSNNFLDKISKDENLRNDLINKILANRNFIQEFEKMVDIHIRNKINMTTEDKKEKSNIGGFDNV